MLGNSIAEYFTTLFIKGKKGDSTNKIQNEDEQIVEKAM